MMMPFLFRVGEDSGTFRKYVVMLASANYKGYDAEWMCDPSVGTGPLVPDVDSAHAHYEFDNEADALKCMQFLWAGLDFSD